MDCETARPLIEPLCDDELDVASAARVVALCGRHGIEMFALGTLLSFAGWIVLEEAGTTATRSVRRPVPRA